MRTNESFESRALQRGTQLVVGSGAYAMNLFKIMTDLFNRKHINDKNDARFAALTPTDEADKVEKYIDALTYALSKDPIKNIALTGPYGSGKTSIIKTFEKINKYKFLYISLATFKESLEEKGPNEDQTNMIERSILQQMLYDADANKLPYSRFRRIAIPEYPFLKSMAVVFWIVVSTYLYSSREKFLTMEFFTHLSWYSVLIIFTLGIATIMISAIYKATYGMSLKKVSLKDAEIETAELPEKSILNRHIDEIIYFFQMTEYNVVVIEDLDRFESPEIFLKLREINKLINDNKKTSGKIKFLYALRDDMFANKNRTKFFDFIIPVVPIINRANSLDKMQERLRNEPFSRKIEQQFLREVALHIDDLRLMNNIFNEFTIYNAKLGSDSLNMTRLLAMMIYKNVYPSDFEKLHHGKGALYEICRKRSGLIAETKQKLSTEIADIQKEISNSEAEEAKSVDELIEMFVGHIVTSAGKPAVQGIYIDSTLLQFTQLKTWSSFEGLFQIQNVHISVPNPQSYGQLSYQRVALGRSFSQLETEVSPHQTFTQRKKNIENKTASERVALHSKIHQLEKEKTKVSQMALYELLQKNNISIEEEIANNKIDDKGLLVYLVKNGYLDENYHQYVSNFHEGRLTKNDRDFLLTIRDFKSPDPKQPLDNLAEVITNMRSDDFGQKYVLNVALVDFLLKEINKYKREIHSAVDYISSNFEEAEDFFAAYLDVGINVNDLVKAISEKWPEYGAAAVKSTQAPDHLARILSNVRSKYISEKMNPENVITDYLAEQGHLVFASDISAPSDYGVLRELKVKFRHLASILKNEALLDFAHKECLYEINPENIGLLLDSYPRDTATTRPDHVTANYSAICSSGSEELKKYVDDNLSQYIDAVYLTMPDNVNESPEIVKRLINVETIDSEKKRQIISKQKMIFDTFADIPVDLWEYLLSNEKIRVSWVNISNYLNEEKCNREIVTETLNKTQIVNELTEQCGIDHLGAVDSKSLSDFIIENDAIRDAKYENLINCLPFPYDDFPKGISITKKYALAKGGAVNLTDESYASAEDDDELFYILIATNIKEYLANKDKYPITEHVREKLLSLALSDEQRIQILRNVTLSGVQTSGKLFHLVEELIKLPEMDCLLFNGDVVSYVIVNAQNVEDGLRIFMKCIPHWDKKMVMSVLEQLQAPFNEIPEYGKITKISKTPINQQFAELLETYKIISSITEKDDAIRINTFKTPD